MLKRLHLEGLKSFDDETIPLGPVTLLVGANATGKSNLLDAVRVLQGIALDMPVGDVLQGRSDGGRQIWPGVRGGISDIALRGRDRFVIESTWRLRDGQGTEDLTHRIAVDVASHPVLAAEKLESSRIEGYVFDTHAPALRDKAGRDAGSSIRVALKRVGKGNSPVQVHSANRSLLKQVDTALPVSPEVARVCSALSNAMKSPYFLDIAPARMRGYVPKHVDTLGTDGHNVSALAWSICQDREAKEDLVDWLGELCAPEMEDFDFVETDIGDVMLVLVERTGRRIPARSLSDGTLRFLGLLIALRTAPDGSLLLLEELENGLHPRRAHLLVEAMEFAAAARDVQVVATTHSPLVLNALSPEALRDAVLFARPPGSEATVTRRFGEIPGFEEVVKRRGVERLFVSGWLERALPDEGAL